MDRQRHYKDTRSADLEELRRSYGAASNDERRRIEETAHKIKNESRETRAMREALLKAHRSGDREEIKDIHEYIRNKSQYRNG